MDRPVTVQILEDGEIVETQDIPTNGYVVLTHGRRRVTGYQQYGNGTVVITTKLSDDA